AIWQMSLWELEAGPYPEHLGELYYQKMQCHHRPGGLEGGVEGAELKGGPAVGLTDLNLKGGAINLSHIESWNCEAGASLHEAIEPGNCEAGATNEGIKPQNCDAGARSENLVMSYGWRLLDSFMKMRYFNIEDNPVGWEFLFGYMGKFKHSLREWRHEIKKKCFDCFTHNWERVYKRDKRVEPELPICKNPTT
ncbi:uncharacterized protein A4U43_C09F11990, partial [Asparagus officinalis]